MTFPGFKEVDILSSVTSTSIQKISLVHRHLDPYIAWSCFDKPLCRLANELGCTHKLEVDFRISVEGVVETGEDIAVAGIADNLSGFREKGQLRVVLVGPDESESVIYPQSQPR